MIAEVLIDLKAISIDKPYSYNVPEEFLDLVQIGERVYVPFGNMKRMGFIIGIKNEDRNENYKDIIEVLDITPVVTKELIELSSELSRTSFYPMVSYLLTMVPSSLKAKYKKKLVLKDKDDMSLFFIFNDKDVVDYDTLDKESLSIIKKAINEGKVELKLEFDTNESIKSEKRIKVISNITIMSDKRTQIVNFIKENNNDVDWITLRDSFNVSFDTIKRMCDKGILEVYEKEVYRDITTLKPFKDKVVELNDEQKEVFKEINNNLNNDETYLLKGVTGSGKTEIYLSIIEEVLKAGKDSIVLVPEISLTPMMVNRFKSRFKDKVAIFHSELSQNTRYDEWRKVLRGEAKIAVGARSAIFTPFKNLGLIVIDEEHESSYKQDTAPIYHAIQVAKIRTRINKCPLILGSATPSIESYARATNGIYKLVELKNRANNKPLPKSVLVDLNQEIKSGNFSSISKRLSLEIENRLLKNEQTILLLNRRGYSQYIMCRACGEVPSCPNCSVSLTYHSFDNTLKCHYCGYSKKANMECDICHSKSMETIGTGTEKVEEELKELFPEARIVRMDNDTVKGKNGHERVLNEFEFNGDILLGTQMIAKGLDYPNVTLVGVLNADQMLKNPSFKSKEETFSLLTQVSGRCGRGEKDGLVVVQTFNKDHYAIKAGLAQNYDMFFNEEMNIRKLAKFTPYYNLINIKVKALNANECFNKASEIKNRFKETFKDKMIVLGPIKPTIHKIDSLYIFNIILKYRKIDSLNKIMKELFDEFMNDEVYISIDKFPVEL